MSDFIPMNFGEQSCLEYFNAQPSAVKGQSNFATQFYKRYLYNLIYSLFEFENLPNDWKINYFRLWLFQFGSIAVVYTKKFGWICHPYSIVKLDMYYNPKIIQINNRFINKPVVGVIGTNAQVLHCFDDFYGFEPIVIQYAEKLASCDKDIDISLMNANVTMSAEVSSKKEGEALKKAYEDATTGKPLIVMNNNILKGKPITTFMANPKNNFIAKDILDAKRTIINEFLTVIGIRNANYDKKERLNSQEVNENNDETKALISVVFDNLSDDIKRLNDLSGLNIKIKLRYDYDEEVVDNAI